MKGKTELHRFLPALLLAWSLGGSAHEASESSWIIVRGAIEGCEIWTNRVLDIEQPNENGTVELLGLPAISVVGLDGDAIRLQLLSEIKSRTGNRSGTLQVSIENGIRLHRETFNNYKTSLVLLGKGKCPRDPDPNSIRFQDGISKPRDGLEYMEEEIQEIEYMELLQSLS